MQFYVLVNNEQQGPFSVDQIKGYLAMGHFQHSHLAWHEGLPEWKPLDQFPEFAAKAHRTPNYKSVPVRDLTPPIHEAGDSSSACERIVAIARVSRRDTCI